MNKWTGRVGMSLIEVLVVIIFLSLVMLSLISWNSMSNRSSMDTHYEFLAFQLAREPIEAFRAYGYEWAKDACEKGRCGSVITLGSWQPIVDGGADGIRYPSECHSFKRRIVMTKIPGPPDLIRVEVEVAPKDSTRAEEWLTQAQVKMVGLMVENPK